MFGFLKDVFWRGYLRFYLALMLRFCKACVRSGSWNNFFSYWEWERQNRVRLFGSLYLNFRSFPAKTAWRIPVYVYGKMDYPSLSGTMCIESTPVTTGMIRIGYTWGFRSQGVTRIHNKGKIIYKGFSLLMRGGEIAVRENALLELGNHTTLGENCLVMCKDHIILHDHVRITYQSQLFDTDYHYIISLKEKTIKPRMATIEIGNYCWIGNRTTIKKGVKIPNYTIVASNSVLTKDYTKVVEPFSVLGGLPAKVLATGLVRTWHDEMERIRLLDAYFAAHPDDRVYHLGEDETIEDYIYGRV